MEGGRGHGLRLNATTQHLNFQASLEHPSFRPRYSLECVLRGNSAAKTTLILKSLRWVAYAFRPLTTEELLTALRTSTEINELHDGDCHSQTDAKLPTFRNLEDMCKGMLKIGPNRTVDFCDSDLKSFVLSPALSTVDPCQEHVIHGMMAVVCLKHFHRLQLETLFRPWLFTEQWLRGQIKPCHLRNYALSYWQEHFRIAEPCSVYLPALLDRTIQSALSETTLERGYEDLGNDRRVNTGLWICSLYDFKVLGKTYLQMGADVQYRHALNETPLHIAAANSSANMLRLLLEEGADPDVADMRGMSALHHSSVAGRSEAVSLLLDHGANVNAVTCQCGRAHDWDCRKDRTPLQLAAQNGHAQIVRLLLEAGSRLNDATRSSRKTALHFAVEYGDEDTVRYLMDCGADLEAQTAASETALQIAIEERHDSIVQMFIDRGVNPRVASAADTRQLNAALSGIDVAQTMTRFDSLSLEHVSSYGQPRLMPHPGTRFPILMIPTTYDRFVQQELEEADQDGWFLVDKFRAQVDL